MTVDYNFVKGVDVPAWQWMSYNPQGSSQIGSACTYDGRRYLYWSTQSSTTTAGASGGTSELWRYDTWTNGWQRLQTLNTANNGVDIEYDPIRNVLYLSQGQPGTALQCFNLNTTAVTIANVVVNPMALATLPALPATPGAASSLTMPDDSASNGGFVTPNPLSIDTGTVAAGTTTTSLIDTKNPGTFAGGMVGLYVRMTSGALSGQRRQITAVPGPTALTVTAFGSAPAANDTFVVELPEGTATSGSSTTLVDTAQAWITNLYANSDVIIVSGTGAGQRRRIASNTATTLTLSAAVTGNARTGNWATAPDATSIYRIVPSSDFLYWQNGGTANIYRLDVAQTTGAAWSAALTAAPAATGGGGNTMYAGLYDPFAIVAVRGSGTATLYRYRLGPNDWQTLTTQWGVETINTGAAIAMMHGKRKLFIQKESSVRCYAHDFTTGQLEPAGFMPYANPAAYDGKRARFVKTQSGVEWVYLQRAGAQELLRMPVEWL